MIDLFVIIFTFSVLIGVVIFYPFFFQKNKTLSIKKAFSRDRETYSPELARMFKTVIFVFCALVVGALTASVSNFEQTREAYSILLVIVVIALLML